MSFFSELEDITDEAISFFGKDSEGEQMTLVYAGVTVPCYEDSLSEEERALMEGGSIGSIDMVVRAKASAFPSRPKGMERVTIGGVTRQIAKVLSSHGDPEIGLALHTLKQRGK